jgi:hypothetical protein
MAEQSTMEFAVASAASENQVERSEAAMTTLNAAAAAGGSGSGGAGSMSVGIDYGAAAGGSSGGAATRRGAGLPLQQHTVPVVLAGAGGTTITIRPRAGSAQAQSVAALGGVSAQQLHAAVAGLGAASIGTLHPASASSTTAAAGGGLPPARPVALSRGSVGSLRISEDVAALIRKHTESNLLAAAAAGGRLDASPAGGGSAASVSGQPGLASSSPALLPLSGTGRPRGASDAGSVASRVTADGLRRRAAATAAASSAAAAASMGRSAFATTEALIAPSTRDANDDSMTGFPVRQASMVGARLAAKMLDGRTPLRDAFDEGDDEDAYSRDGDEDDDDEDGDGDDDDDDRGLDEGGTDAGGSVAGGSRAERASLVSLGVGKGGLAAATGGGGGGASPGGGKGGGAASPAPKKPLFARRGKRKAAVGTCQRLRGWVISHILATYTFVTAVLLVLVALLMKFAFPGDSFGENPAYKWLFLFGGCLGLLLPLQLLEDAFFRWLELFGNDRPLLFDAVDFVLSARGCIAPIIVAVFAMLMKEQTFKMTFDSGGK